MAQLLHQLNLALVHLLQRLEEQHLELIFGDCSVLVLVELLQECCEVALRRVRNAHRRCNALQGFIQLVMVNLATAILINGVERHIADGRDLFRLG